MKCEEVANDCGLCGNVRVRKLMPGLIQGIKLISILVYYGGKLLIGAVREL